jgi:lysozyme
MRRISGAGLALLKKAEGLRLDAYRDGGGVLTIGYGHTGKDVHEGMSITPGEAERLLMVDLCWAEAGVDALTRDVPTSDCQFAAMVLLTYNIGFGDPNHKPKPIPGFKTSTVLKMHRLGNYPRAAKAFLLWNKDNGRVIKGLVNRREMERALYLGELA